MRNILSFRETSYNSKTNDSSIHYVRYDLSTCFHEYYTPLTFDRQLSETPCRVWDSYGAMAKFNQVDTDGPNCVLTPISP